MIEVSNLTKDYGTKKALDNLSFSIDSGEVVGFLGPNGAGKTTTMNIITGYLSSTSGTVKIDDIDILEDPIAVKRKIGYLPEHPPLYLDMTVKEYLNFVCDLKGYNKNRKQHIEEICNLVRIEAVFSRLIKNLSKGYRQRVGMAQALIGNPEVLILDEPTVGLDPKEIIEIRKLIEKLGRKRTLILSSHILSEIQAVCDRVIIVNNGRLVADGNTRSLSESMSKNMSFYIRVMASADNKTEGILRNTPGVKGVRSRGIVEKGCQDFEVTCEETVDARSAVFNALAVSKLPIMMLKPSEMTLEDIFLRLISRDTASNDAKGGDK